MGNSNSIGVVVKKTVVAFFDLAAVSVLISLRSFRTCHGWAWAQPPVVR
jgi:hypothetical protein